MGSIVNQVVAALFHSGVSVPSALLRHPFRSGCLSIADPCEPEPSHCPRPLLSEEGYAGHPGPGRDRRCRPDQGADGPRVCTCWTQSGVRQVLCAFSWPGMLERARRPSPKCCEPCHPYLAQGLRLRLSRQSGTHNGPDAKELDLGHPDVIWEYADDI
jgi:hypothetical protein